VAEEYNLTKGTASEDTDRGGISADTGMKSKSDRGGIPAYPGNDVKITYMHNSTAYNVIFLLDKNQKLPGFQIQFCNCG
jgi:hypothetical protein